VLATARGHTDKTLCARWHPALPALVTSSADKTAILWSLAGGEL
jgi:WD40 repeat protein